MCKEQTPKRISVALNVIQAAEILLVLPLIRLRCIHCCNAPWTQRVLLYYLCGQRCRYTEYPVEIPGRHIRLAGQEHVNICGLMGIHGESTMYFDRHTNTCRHEF